MLARALRERAGLAAHVMVERAAAALARRTTTSTPWRVSRRIVAALI